MSTSSRARSDAHATPVSFTAELSCSLRRYCGSSRSSSAASSAASANRYAPRHDSYDLSRDRHYENSASDITDRALGSKAKSAYVPWIKRVVSDIVRQREFNGVDGRPTKWNTAHDVNYLGARAVSKHSVADAKKRATRFVVFVVGGITHAEVRRLKELASEIPGVVITIGSTALVTPCGFLHHLERYEARCQEDQLWLDASAQGQALSAARGQL
jgi:hypothetical protein